MTRPIKQWWPEDRNRAAFPFSLGEISSDKKKKKGLRLLCGRLRAILETQEEEEGTDLYFPPPV